MCGRQYGNLVISVQFPVTMTLKEVILEYSRKRVKYPCLNCAVNIYVKVNFFIGVCITGTCKHEEKTKCEFKTRFIAVIVSCLYGLILLASSIYQLRSVYNGQLKFGDVKNMKAIAEFFLGLAQGLVILFFSRNHRIFKSLLNSMQDCIFNLKSIASEDEIVEVCLLTKLQTDFFTLFSISFSTCCMVYKYFVEHNLDVVVILKIYPMLQIPLGMVWVISFHKNAMDICYNKLRKILAFTLNDDECCGLTTEENLDWILEFRQTCYRSYTKINEVVSPSLYMFILFNIVAYCVVILIAVIKMLDGELFRSMNETPVIVMVAIGFVVSCYVCSMSQQVKYMVRLMK